MPTQIGPDMLANLDRQRDIGSIDPHAHEARKLEIQELIRKGQAFTLSKVEKVLWSAVSAFFVLLGLLAFGGNILGIILGIGMLVFGFNRLAMVIRH